MKMDHPIATATGLDENFCFIKKHREVSPFVVELHSLANSD
jgi:hypothetical protein